MKKILLLLTILSFVGVDELLAQSLDYKNVVKAMNTISKSAVYVVRSPKTGTGTLFWIPYTDTSSIGGNYVLTAKHILDDEDSLGNVTYSHDTCLVYFNVLGKKPESRMYLVIKRWLGKDVVVLGPLERFRSFEEYDTHAAIYSTGDSSEIATFKDIVRCQTAFLAGFPLNIGANMNTYLNPVVQAGIIAQVDSAKQLIIVDMPVNHGNSGCPVYTIAMDKRGSVKLLGLVFEYQDSDDMVLRKVQGTGLDLTTIPHDTTKTLFALTRRHPGYVLAPANSGLGRVVMLAPLMDDIKKLVQGK